MYAFVDHTLTIDRWYVLDVVGYTIYVWLGMKRGYNTSVTVDQTLGLQCKCDWGSNIVVTIQV